MTASPWFLTQSSAVKKVFSRIYRKKNYNFFGGTLATESKKQILRYINTGSRDNTKPKSKVDNVRSKLSKMNNKKMT